MTGLIDVSIIIPTHDRPHLLWACVESVLAQAAPALTWEVIVVDDGSRNDVAAVLHPYLQAGRVRLVRQSQRGWGAARQLGAAHSQGGQLLFLDDDCAAPQGWLAAYTGAWAGHPDAAVVGGGLRPGPRMNVAGCKQYLGHLVYFEQLNAPLGGDTGKPGRVWFTFGGNRSFRREVWEAVQPLEPGWYFDDYTIDLALRDAGYAVYYEPEAWATHHYVLSLSQRLRAAYRYGFSERSGSGPHIETPPARTLAERWRRMRAECPGVPVWAYLWYAGTQPLVWLARRMGKRRR